MADELTEALVDYRDLLRRYIDHVGQCEGSVFLGHSRGGSDVIFTDGEWAELGRLAGDSG